MKKNTTNFDTLIDEFFNMLNEAGLDKSNQNKDKCAESCHCEDCHFYDKCDENDEEEEEDDEYNPNLEVLSYTDEDFKDTEKLEEYVNELENLLLTFEHMSVNEVALLSLLFKNDNIPEYIEKLIDHAYDVNHAAIREREEEEKRKKEEANKHEEQNKFGVNKLASRYVDEVFVPILRKAGANIPKSQITALKTSFTDFGKWILNQ